MSMRWLYSTNLLGAGAMWTIEDLDPALAVRTLVLPRSAVVLVAAHPRRWARRRATCLGGARIVVLGCGDWSELYARGQRLGWVRSSSLRGID